MHDMKKLLRSFVYAARGISSAVGEQQNLKIHIGIAFAVIAAGIYFDITAIEWCVLLLAIALVIGLELVNSALESIVDLVTREQHPLAGKAKDMAAGAVLFASIIAVVVGIIVFGKYLAI
jgi:diacylglycerol kinase